MHVRIDPVLCQGHNVCYGISPELFDVTDDGTSVVRVEGDVPSTLEPFARRAALNCPERAIELTQEHPG